MHRILARQMQEHLEGVSGLDLDKIEDFIAAIDANYLRHDGAIGAVRDELDAVSMELWCQ